MRHSDYLGGPRPFPETSWGLIHRCRDVREASFRDGFDRLFRKYWGPVYLFVLRNWAKNPEEAKDLTQDFFASLIERDALRGVDAEKGRFRSFICAALRNFLANARRAERAKKRRPDQALVSLDRPDLVRGRLAVPEALAPDPNVQFDEDWKRAVLDAVLEELRPRAAAAGKEILVDLLVRYDLDKKAGERQTYGDLALEFGLTVFQVRNGLHWIRKEFMEALRRELEDQVSTDEDYRLEAGELFGM